MTQFDYKWLQLYKLWLDKVLVSEIHLPVHLNVLRSDAENRDEIERVQRVPWPSPRDSLWEAPRDPPDFKRRRYGKWIDIQKTNLAILKMIFFLFNPYSLRQGMHITNRAIITCQGCSQKVQEWMKKCNMKDSGQHYEQLCIFNKQNLSRSDVKHPSCNIMSTVFIFINTQTALNSRSLTAERGERENVTSVFCKRAEFTCWESKRSQLQVAGWGGG